MPNGGAATTSSATSSFINGDTSETSSKMREKLAALEDLNELLEEPVEEQVSVLTSYLERYFIWNTVTQVYAIKFSQYWSFFKALQKCQIFKGNFGNFYSMGLTKSLKLIIVKGDCLDLGLCTD